MRADESEVLSYARVVVQYSFIECLVYVVSCVHMCSFERLGLNALFACAG
jgi:hypothetical protein